MKKILIHLIYFLLMLIGCCSLSAQTIIELSNGTDIIQIDSSYFLLTGFDTCEIVTDKILVKYQTTANDTDIVEIEQNYQLENKFLLKSGWIIYYIPPQQDYISFIEDLLNEDNVENVEVDFLFSYQATPNDPAYLNGDIWYIDNLNMPSAWDIEVGHDDVIVGVLDSGFDWDVEDFGPDNGIGYNHIYQNEYTYPIYLGSGNYNYHGTKTAGIIAGKTNNGTQISGIAGGWNSNPVKIDMQVVGHDGADYTAAAAGLYTAVWLDNASVINMSFGLLTPDPLPPNTEALQSEIEMAYGKGVTMFASNGNVHRLNECEPVPLESKYIAWPAKSEFVIAVGATQPDPIADIHWHEVVWAPGDLMSAYSSDTELSAPGKDIYVYDNGNWTVQSGTSFSTAMASGVAALMISANPCLYNTDIEYILKETARKANPDFCWGYEYDWNEEKPGHCIYLGYGVIDAYQALLLATSHNINEVTTNETWSEPKWFNHDLTIKSGGNLTITTTVKFCPGNKIIVEPGAHLLIDGGTLTCSCNDLWGGIEVQGNPELSQNPGTNQGCVEIINSGKIEKATYGIYSSNGGIVFATDAMFHNNYRAVHFENYPDVNRSFFTRCTFDWGEDLDPAVNTFLDGSQYFIGAEYVSPIKVYGCTFENNVNINSLPFNERGYGILANNAKFIISGASSQPAVGDPNEIKTYFKKLYYGARFLRAFNTYDLNIAHSRFENNLKGLSIGGFTGQSFAQVVLSEFKVLPPSLIPGNYDSYGMYLNNCSGYIVEDNEFYRESTTPEGIGLVINESGPYDNMIYNNSFQYLEYAVIAQGCNRNDDLMGLCFKCNDFSHNTNDIVITSSAPESPDQGINVNQGNKTSAAKNTFTIQNNEYDINNPFDQITYYHDQYSGQNPVIPVPTIGVTNYQVFGSTYDKQIDCPSNYSGGGSGIDELTEDLNEAKAASDSLEQVLYQLIDGGSTGNLVNEVEYTSSQTALETRDMLIQESPFLSDSVMKTAINNEIALPNSMIRDVFLVNPQSAKSGDVLGALNQRVVPMPDSMMVQIMGGLEVIGEKEELTGLFSIWNQRYLTAFQKILHLYYEDTTGQYGFDSIVSLMNQKEGLSNRYELVTLFYGNGMYSEGNQILNTIPQQFQLSATETENHNKFVTLSLIMEQVNSDSAGINSLDSSQIATLTTMASGTHCMAGIFSRNLLIMSGNIGYTEPIILPVVSSRPAWHPLTTDPSNLDQNKYYLRVFPNPASNYFIVDYQINVPVKPNESISIVLTDELGRELKSYYRTIQYDQITVATNGLASGNHFVVLKIGQTPQKTIKIVLNK